MPIPVELVNFAGIGCQSVVIYTVRRAIPKGVTGRICVDRSVCGIAVEVILLAVVAIRWAKRAHIAVDGKWKFVGVSAIGTRKDRTTLDTVERGTRVIEVGGIEHTRRARRQRWEAKAHGNGEDRHRTRKFHKTPKSPNWELSIIIDENDLKRDNNLKELLTRFLVNRLETQLGVATSSDWTISAVAPGSVLTLRVEHAKCTWRFALKLLPGIACPPPLLSRGCPQTQLGLAGRGA